MGGAFSLIHLLDQFDAFISASSVDYPYANEVHDFLVTNGKRPFFCRVSLPDVGISEYGQIIDQVLERVPHCILVTSSREHATSPWVEHEWRSFHQEKLGGRKTGNLVTVLAGKMEVGDLPMTLRGYQAVPMTSLSEVLRYLSPSSGELPPAFPAGEFNKDKVAPIHPLHQFPLGPRVLDRHITGRIVRAFAGFYNKPPLCALALREANDLRVDADPDVDPMGIAIDFSEIPSPESVPSLAFWSDVWLVAARKGPRMVGALLLTADRAAFDSDTQSDIHRLVATMRKM